MHHPFPQYGVLDAKAASVGSRRLARAQRTALPKHAKAAIASRRAEASAKPWKWTPKGYADNAGTVRATISGGGAQWPIGTTVADGNGDRYSVVGVDNGTGTAILKPAQWASFTADGTFMVVDDPTDGTP